MPTYVTLLKWTDQGRKEVAGLPDRVAQVSEQAEKMGVRPLAQLVTMGRYDQVILLDAPDDEAVAKVMLLVAGRGNAETETLRGWTMDEVRGLL